jgi:hypothetical protein
MKKRTATVVFAAVLLASCRKWGLVSLLMRWVRRAVLYVARGRLSGGDKPVRYTRQALLALRHACDGMVAPPLPFTMQVVVDTVRSGGGKTGRPRQRHGRKKDTASESPCSTPAQVAALLASGALVRATLHVSRLNKRQAFGVVEGLPGDIFLDGDQVPH